MQQLYIKYVYHVIRDSMGHIAQPHLSNNSHDKINFMESNTKFLDNVVEWFLYKKDILMQNSNPLLKQDDF